MQSFIEIELVIWEKVWEGVHYCPQRQDQIRGRKTLAKLS